MVDVGSRVIPALRTLAVRALLSSWHAGVDLERVPSALAFELYDRLRARGAGEGGAQPVSCAELYPFVRSKWQVDSLDLSDCRDWLVDTSMNSLCYVPSLRGLALIGCARLSDAGMSCLRSLPVLTDLDVSWCSGLTDGALQHLAHLAGSLRSLNLTGTAITDAGIPAVLQLRGLQRLGLGSTAIRDLGMDYLTYYTRYPAAGQQQGVHELEWLSLMGTAITDVGLLKLCATQGGIVFKKLRLLVLSSTPGLSTKAVNEVRLKHKFMAPLPNAPRTLASTNRDAMLGEAWLTRISPADDRRTAASRSVDGRPSESSWVEEGLRHLVLRFTQETAGAQSRAHRAPGGLAIVAELAEPVGAKRKHH